MTLTLRNLLIAILALFVYACASSDSSSNNPEGSATTKMQTAAAYALDGTPLYPPAETAASRQRKDSLLAIAEADFQTDSHKLDNIIWYGRRLAYLSRYQEAIEVYTKGMQDHPDSPELYRHRGHRYISIRKFDQAIADFEQAAQLAEGRPVEIEPDGIPNKINIPLSTLQFNIYYHLALTHYLKGEFEKAVTIYEKCMEYSTNPDLLIATTDWLYMSYQRMGQEEKATDLLQAISSEMEIIENTSYLTRLLLYKGEKEAKELLDLTNTTPEDQLDIVTQGYGVANWHYYNGRKDQAIAILEQLMKTDYWSAFGYIAAEADLERMR